MGKKLLILLQIIIITLPLTLSFTKTQQSRATSPTTLYINPSSINVNLGQNFTITIEVTDVTDLCGWEFKLYFKKDIVNAISCEEGPFLKSSGSTTFLVPEFTNNYNETHGRIGMLCTLNNFTAGGVDGSGTLASITFKSVGGGFTPLTLKDTILNNSTIQHIPHVTIDANVEVFGGDIAITNIKTSKTIVGQGYSMDINVTVENQGTTTETFNLTVYANTSEIETKQINLDSNTSITITFTWNTTGFAKGNYTITAYAWPLPGEADIADNSLTDGWIYISLIGDIMGPDGYPDGKVDIRDVACVARLFGVNYPDPKYDPNCDFTGPTLGMADGKIDIRDIAVVAKHFGETDP